MKPLRLLILLLLIAPVYATFDSVEKTLTVGEVYEDSTRSIELVAVNSESRVVVKIDDQFSDTVFVGQTKTIEGVNITLNETLYVANMSERKATINIQVLWKHDCDVDSDCDDGDACTINSCTGHPRGCDYDDSEKDVTECKADGCCADSCSYVNDPDCDKPCSKDAQCDDDDPGTIDECTGEKTDPGICLHTPKTECDNEDDFCPVGCKFGRDQAETSDTDCSINNECASNTDCDDGDESTEETCEGYGTDEDIRVCVYIEISNCINNDGQCPTECTTLNDNDCIITPFCGDGICGVGENCDECFADCACAEGLACDAGVCVEPVRVCEDIGDRSRLDFGGEFYCSKFGWKSIKAGGSRCINNYECKSETCEEERCVSTEIVKERSQRQIALVALLIVVAGAILYLLTILKISHKAEKL